MNSLNGSVHLQPSEREGETALERGWFVAKGPVAHSTDPSAFTMPGYDLTIQDYAELEARWIDRTLAIQAGFRRVDSIAGAEIVGRKGRQLLRDRDSLFPAGLRPRSRAPLAP